jgi:hypothetical protein
MTSRMNPTSYLRKKNFQGHKIKQDGMGNGEDEKGISSFIKKKKHEGRTLARLRHRWEDNVKINLKERGCENIGFNWFRRGFSDRLL